MQFPYILNDLLSTTKNWPVWDFPYKSKTESEFARLRVSVGVKSSKFYELTGPDEFVITYNTRTRVLHATSLALYVTWLKHSFSYFMCSEVPYREVQNSCVVTLAQYRRSKWLLMEYQIHLIIDKQLKVYWTIKKNWENPLHCWSERLPLVIKKTPDYNINTEIK